MKMKEYFDQLSVGEVVNKRGLAYLKRIGLLWEYSEWGYLESISIKPSDETWYNFDRELFPNGNARECEKMKGAWHNDCGRQLFGDSELTRDELREKFPSGSISALGNTFDTKYLDGCFKPYLIKTGPSNGKEVNRHMVLWGAIV